MNGCPYYNELIPIYMRRTHILMALKIRKFRVIHSIFPTILRILEVFFHHL